MRKKRLVILHHCDSLGGAGVSLFYTYRMLKDLYDVRVYLPYGNSRLADFLRKREVEVNAIDDNVGMISIYSGGPKLFSRTFVKNFLEIKQTKRALEKIIKQDKPDIIAVNSMTLAWAGKYIQKNNIKSICFVRETYINNIGMKYIKFCLDKWFDGVIFLSEYDKKVFNCRKPLVRVVHDCVQQKDYSINFNRKEACRYLKIEYNYFNVLFLGGTDELKGWPIIKSAMERLENYNIRLIVAGDIGKKKVIENKNIVFIGSRIDMPQVYRACDVLVFPSTFPHQARPAFEAGMMGLPVIISDFEETREFIRDGENGLTFEPKNSKDLALKIEKLFNDTRLRKMLGMANKENAVNNHEFNICKKELLDFMNSDRVY